MPKDSSSVAAVAAGVGLVGLAAWAVKQRQEDTWERTLERV